MKMAKKFKYQRIAVLSVWLMLSFISSLGKATTLGEEFGKCCSSRNGITTECQRYCNGYLTKMNGTEVCAAHFNRILKCNDGNSDRETCCNRSLIPKECRQFCSNYDRWLVAFTSVCGEQRHRIMLCFMEAASTELPPIFAADLQKNYVFQVDEELTIECPAKGRPDVTYDWIKDGERLDDRKLNALNAADWFNGTLYFWRVRENAEGVYQCSARNNLGTAASDLIHVKRAFLQTEPRASGNEGIYVTETYPVTIKMNPRRACFPAPSYRWLSGKTVGNMSEISFSNITQMSDNGDLHIAFVLTSNHLEYFQPVTINTRLDVNVTGNMVRLNVTIGRHLYHNITYGRPQIAFSSDNETVALVGRSVTLRCFFSAFSLSTLISWRRLGNASLSDEGFHIENFRTTLTIHNVSESDEGQYQCTGTNLDGAAQQTFHVKVEAIPTFVSFADGPYSRVVSEGSNVTFRCNVTAKPMAQIAWFRNGVHINDKLPARYELTDEGRSLTIRSVCRNCEVSDLMVIQCNASNKHGYVLGSGYLNVLNKTEVSVDSPAKVTINTDNDTQRCICCRAIGDPIISLGTKITWYFKKNGNNAVALKEWSRESQSGITTVDNCLSIAVDVDNSTNWKTYQGEYVCVGEHKYSRDTKNITIYINDNICPAVYNSNGSIEWPRTRIGNISYQPCPNNKTGNCSRTCVMEHEIPSWSEPDCRKCVSKKLVKILDEITEIEKGIGLSNTSAASNVVRLLADFTNDTKGLGYGDLSGSLKAVDRLTKLRSDSSQIPLREEVTSAILVISNLLLPSSAPTWKNLTEDNKTAAAVLMSMGETYGRSLSRIVDQTNDTITKEVTEHVVLEAQSVKVSRLPETFDFPKPSEDKWMENRSDKISITVNAQDIGEEKRDSSLNVWSLYYRNIDDYLPGYEGFSVNSRIISLNVKEIPKERTLKQPVTIALQHNRTAEEKHLRRCVFWKFDNEDNKGEWSEEGCKMDLTLSNASQTVCHCDHLTNFAVLLSNNPSSQEALSIISIIGCTISAVALIITLIIYAVTWEHVKSHQAVVLLNLCIALLLANTVFLAGVGVSRIDSMYGCKAVAVLLHYFFLAALFIMLAEGVQLLIYVIFVFHAKRKSETASLIVAAWVLPLIIVGVTLGVTKTEAYGSKTTEAKAEGEAVKIGDTMNTTEAVNVCWLSTDYGQIWAFAGPALCVIGLNAIIIVVVFTRLFTSKMTAVKSAKNDKMRRIVRQFAVLCPILGIAWLFGVLSMISDFIVFQYIFAIANSFQGLFIFIFHGLYNNKKLKDALSSFPSRSMRRIRKTTKRRKAASSKQKRRSAGKYDVALASVSQDKQLPNQSFTDTIGKETGSSDMTTSTFLSSSATRSDSDTAPGTSCITAEVYGETARVRLINKKATTSA